MITAAEDARVLIARMRVRGARPDRLRTRQHLETLLSLGDVYPTGLPAAAILCVRTLHDPRPGTLRLEGSSLPSAPRWTEAVAASLADIARQAVRPLYHSIPANAQAVLFADRAEMLACLARDWAQGTLLHHWWWQRLLPTPDVNRGVWAAWIEAPQFAPAALAHLAAQGDVVMVVQRMEESVIQAVMRQMCAVYHLRDLMQALDAPVPNSYTPPAEQDTHAPALADEPREKQTPLTPKATHRPLERVAPPWTARVPESLSHSLSLPRRLLIGTALSVVRDPTRVRTASFARETRQWLEIEMALERGEALIRPAPPRNTPSIPLPETSQIHAETLSKEEPASTQNLSTVFEDQPVHDVEAAHIETPLSPDEGTAESTERLPLSESETLFTQYGGLFYLLNLAVHLGFYADYTSPGKRELELSIWDFVALVGAELLGGRPPDPIWGLLARLAGRDDHTTAGESFTPPDIWQIDPRWLTSFSDDKLVPWLCETVEDRLRVVHPAGFLVADVPLQGDGTEQAAALCRLYKAEGVLQSGGKRSSSYDPLRRWLDWLMPYIRARLQQALGVEDVAAMLIPHAARLSITPTHIDVRLDLNTLPIEIRLAGLDRNPNWLAAAGRTILFHFESGLS